MVNSQKMDFRHVFRSSWQIVKNEHWLSIGKLFLKKSKKTLSSRGVMPHRQKHIKCSRFFLVSGRTGKEKRK